MPLFLFIYYFRHYSTVILGSIPYAFMTLREPAPYFFFALAHWAAGSGFEPGSAEQQDDALTPHLFALRRMLSKIRRTLLSHAAPY
jgi:hypothetical protein